MGVDRPRRGPALGGRRLIVDVAPEDLRREHVPHVCVVSGEPTDDIRSVRAARPVGIGSLLLLGPLISLVAAESGGITVHLPVASSVRHRRALALGAAVAGPIVPIAAVVAGLPATVVLAVAVVGALALLAGSLVARRYAPTVQYDAVTDRVRIIGAHEAFVASLVPVTPAR